MVKSLKDDIPQITSDENEALVAEFSRRYVMPFFK
jgi:hypothetical protein